MQLGAGSRCVPGVQGSGPHFPGGHQVCICAEGAGREGEGATGVGCPSGHFPSGPLSPSPVIINYAVGRDMLFCRKAVSYVSAQFFSSIIMGCMALLHFWLLHIR